jgi:ubiquitin carboxyl-terminal hydrolase 4/11
MEGGNPEDVERMDIDGTASPRHNGDPVKDEEAQPSPTASSNKSTLNRQTRATSVDMLRGPNNAPANSEGTSSATAQSIQSDDIADSEGTDPSTVEMQDTPSLPSIDKQVQMVMEQVAIPSKDGDVGYVIANSWLGRVLARSSDKDSHGPYEKDALEGDIGPLDNSSILLRGMFGGGSLGSSFNSC